MRFLALHDGTRGAPLRRQRHGVDRVHADLRVAKLAPCVEEGNAIQREFLIAGDDGAALDGCGRDDDPVEGIGVMSRQRANRFCVLKGDWQFAESSIRDRFGGTPRRPELSERRLDDDFPR